MFYVANDDTGMLPADAIKAGRVITGEGPGVIVAERGDMLSVCIDGEESQFLMERRQVQTPTPWLVVQTVNLGGLPQIDDDIVAVAHPTNAFFATEEEALQWVSRTCAENETVCVINILTGGIQLNQHLGVLIYDSPIQRFDCYVNRWSQSVFTFFPRVLAQEVIGRFMDEMGNCAGSLGGICLSALVDLDEKKLKAICITTCMRVVILHLYAEEGAIVKQ